LSHARAMLIIHLSHFIAQLKIHHLQSLFQINVYHISTEPNRSLSLSRKKKIENHSVDKVKKL